MGRNQKVCCFGKCSCWIVCAKERRNPCDSDERGSAWIYAEIMNVYEQTIIIRGKRKCVNPLAAAAETPNEQCIGMSKRIFRYIARLRYPESGIPHTLRAKSIHQVLPMLSECASKNSFYICIVIPTRKDSSPGTRSRSPPWLSMIFRTEESPIP